MFESLESGIGLEIILWLQNIRTPWMETLTIILAELGNEFGYIVLFGLIFWAFSKRHGIRLVYALIIMGLVTFALKDLFTRPRPYMVSDLVHPVFEAYSFGVPSGHTAFAVVIWGYIALWVRKGWMWAFAIFYMVLQGLGRMVAGVHFPQDVIAGALLGLIVLAIYYPMVNHWGSFWNQQRFRTQITLAILIPLILSLILFFIPLDTEQIEFYLTLLGLAIGVGIGAAIEPHFIQFELPVMWWRRLLYLLMGLAILFVVAFALKTLVDSFSQVGLLANVLRLVRYGIIGFTGVSFVPWLAIQLNLIHYMPIDPEAADAVS